MSKRPSPPASRRRRGAGVSLVLAAGLVIGALLVAVVLYRAAAGEIGGDAAAATGTPSSSSAPASTIIDPSVPGALTFQALVTPAELAGIGLSVDEPMVIDAPHFPVLCDAAAWGEQWSAPQEGVGHAYPASGAGISEYALGYADASAAADALGRLVEDAAACPDVAGGGRIEQTPAGGDIGEESAVFLVDDGGRDGAVAVTWTVVVRSGATLLQVAYTTTQTIGTGQGPGEGGGDDGGGDSAQAESTARSIAQVALEHLNP